MPPSWAPPDINIMPGESCVIVCWLACVSSKNILVFIVAFFYAIQFQEEPWQKDCFCGYAEKPSLYPHSSFDKSSMAANPWIAQIYNKIDVRFITIQNFVDNFLCVGSIISKKHILTSKWCFGEPLNEVDLYSHRKPRSGPNGDINAFTKLKQTESIHPHQIIIWYKICACLSTHKSKCYC